MSADASLPGLKSQMPVKVTNMQLISGPFSDRTLGSLFQLNEELIQQELQRGSCARELLFGSGPFFGHFLISNLQPEIKWRVHLEALSQSVFESKQQTQDTFSFVQAPLFYFCFILTARRNHALDRDALSRWWTKAQPAGGKSDPRRWARRHITAQSAIQIAWLQQHQPGRLHGTMECCQRRYTRKPKRDESRNWVSHEFGKIVAWT